MTLQFFRVNALLIPEVKYYGNPLSHEIFKDLESPELYKEEYERLVACYKNGLERMQVIYKQDVIKIKFRNVQGRRALKIQRTRHKDYAEKKKTERKAR
ncbi:hypothetical protein RirG_204240 [Rhizophagus irregularis DAOM 197198w]|uniref:Uncharacterized protein n=1 Tax=Rhizophagus irregularis (strain DAOM 197198w) TaxID=1432141 RepID=A0A015KDW7_RHIIW|nr:hypothetical protein RirG_204240 [Rhizophagus irregularis DAOM 197198w]